MASEREGVGNGPQSAQERRTAPPTGDRDDTGAQRGAEGIPAVIVDIDGTIALRGDRDPHDMTRVGEDQPNWPIVELVHILRAHGLKILFTSGRKESARTDTMNWLLDLFGVPMMAVDAVLLMRADRDVRRDSIIKREIYDRDIAGYYDVRWILDDRQQVVDMWRDLGLTVLQVAPGDF